MCNGTHLSSWASALTVDCPTSLCVHGHPKGKEMKAKDCDPWTLLAVHMAAGSKILDFFYMFTSAFDL